MTALPFTTTTQFVALALTLLAGWLLGLASSSAGRKWRTRFEEEREAHNATRDRAHEELTSSNTRIRELEAENARLQATLAERDDARTGVPDPDPAASDQARSAAMRSWFYGGTDVLSRIHGIDEQDERALNQLGIHHFREIETLAPEDEAPLEGRLGLPNGTIANQRWREQAALLRAGNVQEHARRFA